MHSKSIWSWKCWLKVCRWIQKPVHNHLTQDSGTRGSQGPGLSQVSRNPKQRRNQCKGWILFLSDSPKPFQGSPSYFWIHAPNMMHTLHTTVAFVPSIISQGRKFWLNLLIWHNQFMNSITKTFIRKKESWDTLVISRVDFMITANEKYQANLKWSAAKIGQRKFHAITWQSISRDDRQVWQAAAESNHECRREDRFHCKKRAVHRQKARIHIRIRSVDLNFV